MSDENSESVGTRITEEHVRIETPDAHSLATGKCVQAQCTTTGNECSQKDGHAAACAKLASETQVAGADTIQADAADASSGVEIEKNGKVDNGAWDDMEDAPCDEGEDWVDSIEAAYEGGIIIDSKDDKTEPEDWEAEIFERSSIVSKQPSLDPNTPFVPADYHPKWIPRRALSFTVVEGQFDDADEDT